MAKVFRDCFGFALLRSVIGPENSHHSSQPIRCKTKSNHDLVARVFPRFWQFGCFYFELSLALNHRIISFLLIGRFVINLFLVLRHSIEKRSIIELKIVKLGRQIKRVVVPLSQVWAKETHRYPPPPVEFLRCHSPWAAQILAESRYSTTELQICQCNLVQQSTQSEFLILINMNPVYGRDNFLWSSQP